MQILQDYYALHQIPELGSRLPQTVQYIKQALSPLDCHVFSPTEGSVCAFFDFNRPDTLAFRADCDALPMQEPAAARQTGAMHACGHDGHMAILLELARRIRQPENHNVLLIFQPAEETTGGAKQICETDVLEQYGVRAIFALHLWPGLPKGAVYSRSGVLMAASREVRAEFTGRSVHIANYQQGADALYACCRFYQMAQKQPGFLKFGMLSGGTAGNVVCGKAVLSGSLRSMDEKNQAKLQKLCLRACRRTGCRGELFISEGYPAVRNDPALYRKITEILPVKKLPKPVWTAEDFSFYQQKIPGVYFLLGVGDAPPLHSPAFSFDERVLPKGADLFQSILRLLQLPLDQK